MKNYFIVNNVHQIIIGSCSVVEGVKVNVNKNESLIEVSEETFIQLNGQAKYKTNVLGEIIELIPLAESDYIERNKREPTETEILQAEIEALKQENTLLQAQNQANTDRADFHEDLIAEMAMIVYP